MRRNLDGVVLLVDSRLGFTELDLNLLEFISPRVVTGEVKLLALLTKADKLNRRESRCCTGRGTARAGDSSRPKHPMSA